MAENLRNKRIGKENYNKYGSLMQIVGYRSNRDVDIYFPEYNWTWYHARYDKFESGGISCPYDRKVFDIGYIGEGNYRTKLNNKLVQEYVVWYHMLKRCYETFNTTTPTYENCYVCDDWHNYQNFAYWYNNEYYYCRGERIELDKDILYKGNKLYSPETCIFAPQRINSLFISNSNHRGEYPIGVSKAQYGKNKFTASCNISKNENVFIGSYKTPEEAFIAYKKFKENLIKQIADEYKGLIPDRLYEAMYNYEIEITD